MKRTNHLPVIPPSRFEAVITTPKGPLCGPFFRAPSNRKHRHISAPPHRQLTPPDIRASWQPLTRNDDWSNADLLEAVGALTCSRTLFFHLLESIVSPNARRGKEQTDLVDALNSLLKADGYRHRPSGNISGHTTFSVARLSGGVSGAPKNLIFASTGPKPEIVIQDAINNDIRIVRHGEHCLVYDRPIQSGGLNKAEMLSWWKDGQGIVDDAEARRSLSQRLMASLASKGEQNVFGVYYRAFKDLARMFHKNALCAR